MVARRGGRAGGRLAPERRPGARRRSRWPPALAGGRDRCPSTSPIAASRASRAWCARSRTWPTSRRRRRAISPPPDASTSRPGAAAFFRDPVDTFFPGFVVLALAALRAAVWRSAAGRQIDPDPPRGCSCCVAIARHRLRAVARHADAGLRLGVPRVPADAGPARRGAVRQPVPARHGGARGLGLAGAAPAARRHGAAADRSASCWSRSPTSSRCARRFTYTRVRRHPGDLLAARERTRPGRAGRDAVLSRPRRCSRTPATCSPPPPTGGRS